MNVVLHSIHMVLLVAGLLLLLFAALHDIGFRTVPNHISVSILLLGMVLRSQQGDLGAGLLCGALTFAVTYIFWRFGWIGGADAKLLSASAVFVAPALLPTMIIGTSLSGGVLAAVYVFGGYFAPRKTVLAAPGASIITRVRRCELRRLRRRGPLPYAAAIATGGWIAITGT